MATGHAPPFEPPEALNLRVERSGSTLVFRLAGELDLATIGQVMAAVDRAEVDDASLLVFDLQAVDFLDMAGLGTILRAKEQCQRGDVDVLVVKPRGLARRVFTLTRVDRELDLVDGWAWADLRP